MKNKKGFTLTELIGVIVLLGIIALISVPILNKTIKNSKEKAYNAQVDEIVASAKKWGVTNDEKLPKVDGVSIRVKVPELIAAGILEDDKILDPRNDKEMTSSCVRIRYHESTNEYKYTFEDTCTIDPPRFIDFEYIFVGISFSGGASVVSNIDFSDWKEVVISESENLTFTFKTIAYDTGATSNITANSTTKIFEDDSIFNNAEYMRVTVTDELGQSDYIDLSFRREGCFVAGTKVLTANGYKNIEDLRVGEYVYSYNMETKERELAQIKDTVVNYSTRIYELYINDQIIEVSADHIFYVENKGWIRVDEIELNDKVLTKNGLVPVKNINIHNKEKHTKIFTISVDKNHNFFVTTDDVLVHNKG